MIYKLIVISLVLLCLGLSVVNVQKSNKIETLLNDIDSQQKIINSMPTKSSDNSLVLSKIDADIKSCMEQENYTTYGMSRCVRIYNNIYEREIEKYIAQIKKVWSSSQSVLLEKTQKEWQEYKNANDNFIKNTISHKPGTIYINIADS